MKNYNYVYLDEDVIKYENAEGEKKEKLFWMKDRLILYLIQRVINDNTISSVYLSEEQIQDLLQEYAFSVNNADSRHDIKVPDDLLHLVEKIEKKITENSEQISFETECFTFKLNKENFASVLVEFCEEQLFNQGLFDDLEKNTLIKMSNFYGDYIKDVLLGIIANSGYCDISTIIDRECEIEVKYNNITVISTLKNVLQTEIVLDSELSGTPKLSILIDQKENKDVKLPFPFWKKGDLVAVSLEQSNKICLIGTHINSGINSKVVIE